MTGLPPDLTHAFRVALGARITALEAAGRAQEEGQPGALDSLRRLAHALRGAGGTYGYPDVSAAAAALEDAGVEDAAPRLARLLAALRAAEGPAPGEPQSILVVEDDPAVSALIQMALTAPDRRIVAVQTTLGAQMLLEDHDVDLIVLDLVLPDADGRNLIARLREHPRAARVPIIVLSALTSAQVRTECIALGADEYLAKPFQPPVLVATAARLLALAPDRPPAPATTDAPPPSPRVPRPSPTPMAGAVPELPAVAASPSAVPAPPGPILVADDDDLIAAVIGHRLAREGLEVRRYTDGASAFEAAQTMRPSLVLLDVKMPGMDGFELLERLRALPAFTETPIIMLTSMGNERDIARGLDLGADDYMVKPFSPVELVARVNRHLRR